MTYLVYAEPGGSGDYVDAENYMVRDGVVVFYDGNAIKNPPQDDVVAAYSLENIYKFE